MLDLVRKLMRAERAGIADPGLVMPQLVGGREQRGHPVFLDPVDLQREEDQLRADVGELFLGRLMELGDFRIAHVARKDQRAIAGDPPERFVDLLELLDRAGQRITAKRPDPAFESLPELFRFLGDALEIARKLTRVAAGIEVVEIPGRQGMGGGFFRHLVLIFADSGAVDKKLTSLR